MKITNLNKFCENGLIKFKGKPPEVNFCGKNVKIYSTKATKNDLDNASEEISKCNKKIMEIDEKFFTSKSEKRGDSWMESLGMQKLSWEMKKIALFARYPTIEGYDPKNIKLWRRDFC